MCWRFYNCFLVINVTCLAYFREIKKNTANKCFRYFLLQLFFPAHPLNVSKTEPVFTSSMETMLTMLVTTMTGRKKTAAPQMKFWSFQKNTNLRWTLLKYFDKKSNQIDKIKLLKLPFFFCFFWELLKYRSLKSESK